MSPGEACEPGGEMLTTESLSILEPRSDGVSRTENVETVSLENSLMLGDVFDGIDLQDASVRSQHKDFFDEFELIINASGDFAQESCVDLCEALDVNDYGDDDGMAKQTIDLVQSVAEEVQVDSVEDDEKKVSEVVRTKGEEVPRLVEVVSSGVLETNDGEMERVTSSHVLTDSILRMVEDEDDVEEGEISGDDNMMLIGDDDLPVESHEETPVSQEVLDRRGEETISKSTCSGFEVLNGESEVKENDLTSKNQEQVSECYVADYIMISCMAFTKSDLCFYIFCLQMASQTSIKKKSVPSKEAKARKKVTYLHGNSLQSVFFFVCGMRCLLID